MNAPSIDIKDMLEGNSELGLVFSDNLYISREPAKPNNCVTLYDTPGEPDGLSLDRKERYEYPSVQVRIRNVGYVAAWDLMDDIRMFLHGKAHEEWNEAYYTVIKVSNGPLFLEYDENNRVVIVVTFQIQRRPVVV